jgi:phospholipase C
LSRSLGHLSYEDEGNWPTLEGLRKSTVRNYLNPCIYDNESYYPLSVSDSWYPTDLPHERNYVAKQLSCSSDVCSMTGFTNAYYEYCRDELHLDPSNIVPIEPMGFLGSNDLPVTNFLANNFAVCDHWFASLPTSTHPNRCMALGGSTSIDSTGKYDHSLIVDSLILDWLDKNGVSWRVYTHGVLSSFYLFRMGFIFDSRFRSFKNFKDDINAPEGQFPQVLFIEPSYSGSNENDNHPPLPVGYGELFLGDIYRILISNEERWKKTVMILTYDEHGGFFDHVPPRSLPYAPPHGEFLPFVTTGPRVPAIIVSPLVSARYVYPGNMDHTSILQFLAERFCQLNPQYSDSVNNRRDQGINTVRSVLNLSSPRTDTPPLPTLRGVRKALARKVQVQAEVEKNPLQTSLENVATKAIKLYPDEIKKRHPELLSWYKASLRHLDNNKNRRKFNGKRTTKTGKTRGSR